MRTATITLDEAQREAIREEIRTAAAGCGDIPLCLMPDRDGKTAREYVVRKIDELKRWVAALDAIGWQEQHDGAGKMLVEVDAEFAMWARGQAAELEHAFEWFHVRDEDLDALTGLRLIAEAV
jgi:hypothetical protein